MESCVESQSEIYSVDNETKSWLAYYHAPSMFPVVLKAQHVPADPWSLTSVTAPCYLQSNFTGASSKSLGTSRYLSSGNSGAFYGVIKYLPLNSLLVKSPNLFISKTAELFTYELSSSIMRKFSS